MKHCLPVILVGMCGFCSAQGTNQNSMVISYGMSSPQGDFNKVTTGLGSAKQGWSADMFFQHGLKDKPLGVVAMARHQNYSFNGGNSLRGTDWSISSFLTGAAFQFLSSNRLSIGTHALIGIMFVTSPSTWDGGGFSSQELFTSKNKSSFSYDLGLDVGVPIWRGINLFARMDYQWAKPTFTFGNFFAFQPITIKQPVGSLNTSLGIGYRF